ncbi:MAG: PEGA domain-containing protein [candidate division WOR-3 bacterium]
MLQILLFTVLVFGQGNNGYLMVEADQPGRKVYLDGDSIGTTPITNYPIEPGEYSISLYDSETIENAYWNLRKANLFRKLSAFWELTRIDAGTQRVEIKPNRITKIYFYTSKINQAPFWAKLTFGGCVGGIFGLGILTGILIAR